MKNNIIKTILAYRNQKPEEVLFKKQSGKRANEPISFTRHLIKFFLYKYSGYTTLTIERHMRPLSDGFHHASVLNSAKVVMNQPRIFDRMKIDILKKLAGLEDEED
jgi:hypothetical protein